MASWRSIVAIKQFGRIKLRTVALSSSLKCSGSKNVFKCLRFRVNLLEPSGFGTKNIGNRNWPAEGVQEEIAPKLFNLWIDLVMK
jgi:hypothetical protein